MDETALISKRHLRSMLSKLEDKPDNYAICPLCETIFDERYEACKCASGFY